LEKLSNTTLGDGAQVVDHVFTIHANTVITDSDGTGFGIMHDLDAQFAVILIQGIVVQRSITQLVTGISSIGNQLPQEDFAIGIQRMNHQMEELLDLCLKT